MPQLTLTTKTASYGVLASLPTADVSTVCVAVNPTYYTAAIPAMSPAVALGQFIIIKVTLQNGAGATVRTLRLLRADGSVLLDFPAVSQHALPLGTTTVFSARAIVGNVAEWANVSLQVSSNTAADTVVIKANTLVYAFAELCNIIDEKFIKKNITNIHFMSMQPTQEAVLGKVGSATAIAFGTVVVNGLVSGIQWSANSGNTLYSWSGSSIAIGA